jgi:hypothetical protein
MDELARRAELALDSVDPLFTADEIWRAAIGRILSEVRMDIGRIACAGDTVYESVRLYALGVAGLARNARYLHLMRIVIRDGPAHRWIADAFQAKVAAAIESRLVEAIDRAAKGFGPIALTGNMARWFRISIEQRIAFPQLHPAAERLDSERLDSIAREMAKEIVSRSFLWEVADAAAAARARFPRAPAGLVSAPL